MMTIDGTIDHLVDRLSFDHLRKWADRFDVAYDHSQWLDDEWPDKEDELRTDLADAMKEL